MRLENIPRAFSLTFKTWRIFYLKGRVMRFGPWADYGFAYSHGRFIKWRSFGRLFIEWVPEQ